MKITKITPETRQPTQSQQSQSNQSHNQRQMRITRVVHESENRKKNVAAYARVSTLSEEQDESFETQVSYFTAFIESVEHWNFAGVYADHGKSGLAAKQRPEFMRMIADAMDGKIDIILVKSISRFGRNSLEAQTYVHKLKEKGVEVRFERENISSFNPQADMIFNFLVAVAQEESRSISENVRWTFDKLAEQGIRHVGSNHVLGYGEVNGVLTPNKDAWAVKLIFEEYVNGKSMQDIAGILEDKGFVTMRGKQRLHTSTIAGILRNEIYKGDRLIQKQPPRNLLTHKPDLTREHISYYVEKSHEPIVSPELWEQAQVVLNTPKDPSTFPNKRSHPLRGIVICGECGSKYYRVTRSNSTKKYKCWVCADRRAGKKGKGCMSSIIREDELLEILKRLTGTEVIEIVCEQLEQVFVFADGHVEIEMKEE